MGSPGDRARLLAALHTEFRPHVFLAVGDGEDDRGVPLLTDRTSDGAALAYCHDLAARSPIALRLMKENINRALTSDLATSLDAEATNMVRTMSTADHREATAAFLEKRTPVFHGE